jgi:hypothetical protein
MFSVAIRPLPLPGMSCMVYIALLIILCMATRVGPRSVSDLGPERLWWKLGDMFACGMVTQGQSNRRSFSLLVLW